MRAGHDRAAGRRAAAPVRRASWSSRCPSEPPSYDGHREETFGLIHPFAPFYSTLLRVDPTDPTGTKPVGDLAESWTVSKDGLTYTFKLRHGVKFHDGSEMTSKDVKASYDKIVFPPAGVGSSRKGQYRSIEAIEAPDPYTVRFRLKYPESARSSWRVASPWNFIYKADILAKDIHWYETNVMGTGPFKFVEHVKGSHVVGKKNPDYWDKGKPYLDGFRAVFVASSSAQVAMIRASAATSSSAASARPSATASSRRSGTRSRSRRAPGTASCRSSSTTRRSPSTTSGSAGR